MFSGRKEIKQLLLLLRINATLLRCFFTGKIQSVFEMPTLFIKFPKRTDCFAHFSKLTYLHTYSNMDMRLPVPQLGKANTPTAPDKGRETQKPTTDLHKNTL